LGGSSPCFCHLRKDFSCQGLKSYYN
jgi:hypothetical protein